MSISSYRNGIQPIDLIFVNRYSSASSFWSPWLLPSRRGIANNNTSNSTTLPGSRRRPRLIPLPAGSQRDQPLIFLKDNLHSNTERRMRLSSSTERRTRLGSNTKHQVHLGNNTERRTCLRNNTVDRARLSNNTARRRIPGENTEYRKNPRRLRCLTPPKGKRCPPFKASPNPR